MRRIFAVLAAVLAVGTTALAAVDISGTWQATVTTPNGQQVNTFVFKVDNGKVTGTSSNEMLGTLPIENGSLQGDKISVSVKSSAGVITFSGTVAGESINMTMNVNDGMFTENVEAKRVKS